MDGKQSKQRDVMKIHGEEKEIAEEQLDDANAPKVYKKLSNDQHGKRIAERSVYMKRMSNKSGTSEKNKTSSFNRKKSMHASKENFIKAVERKVRQMSESENSLDKNKHTLEHYIPEHTRKTMEQQLDNQSETKSHEKSMSRRMSRTSNMSDMRRTFVSQITTMDATHSQRLFLTDSERALMQAAFQNASEDADYENVRRMTERSEYIKRTSTKSKDVEVRQKDIENILEAIKPVDMPRTESDDALEKFDKAVRDQSQSNIPTDTSEDEPKGQKSGILSDNESDEQNISELNFRISDTELSQLMKQTSMKHVGKHMIHSRADYMPLSEFEKVVKNLYKCCLKSVTDLHELHLRRQLALPILSDIIARADPEYINTAHVIHMVWSVMSCLHHFQLRLKSGSNRLVMYTRQRMVDKCMDYYLLLIRMFKPNVHRIILSAIITFYKDGKLWDIEFACTDMIVALLDIYPDVEDGVNDLLNSAMYSTSVNPIEAQKLMQVIYEVLRSVKWHKISRKIIDRLIFMLENSLSSKRVSEGNIYAPLRMGIDLCIRHVLSNISNKDVMVVLKRLLKKMIERDLTEESTISFGSLASYAAAAYQMKSFHGSISRDLLFHISLLTHEDSKTTFLTTTRIWLNLIDRNKNGSKLNRPRIFFRDCQYNIMVKKKARRHDRMFFKAHRNYFYELITDCFKKCSDSRIEMYAIFEMCAVLLVEIPCGYTAATFTSIAMSMQEHALRIYTENLVNSNYLHATALSILSLICYVHQAEVFYQYVANIIDCRAEWAPHLIPPLKSKYDYALHHILWKKPELFFEDWEARFGLWKCFRIKRKKRIKLT